MGFKAEQANEHDDKQDDVRDERGNHCRFGVADVEGRAVATGKHPFVAELRET